MSPRQLLQRTAALLSGLVVACAASGLLPSCTVTDFGAVGNNVSEDTGSIAAAIAACQTVVFPAPGRYLMRPVRIDAHDNLTLLVEPGATIVAWGDVETWNATTDGGVAGLFANGYVNCSSSAGLASAGLCPVPVRSFTLTGGGVIDGQGWRWWPFLKTRRRPILLNIENGERLLITNVTLLNSPGFHLKLRGSDIEVGHVTVRAGDCTGWTGAPNTDAVNIGGQRIWVHDCDVLNGDDCVPVDVGWNNTDTDNVLVERVTCACGTNGGVPVVANGASVKNVVFRDMVVRATDQGAGVKIAKSWDDAKGSFQNISWENVTIVNPRYAAIYANMFYEDAVQKHCIVPGNASKRTHWLTASGLTFRGIRAEVNSSVAMAGCFMCGPGRPCTGVAFEDVIVMELGGGPVASVAPYKCNNVQFTAAGSSPSPCGA